MDTPPSGYVLREAVLADAPSLRPLLAQLGYPLDQASIAARIARLAGLDDHLLVVAQSPEGDLHAVMHVYGRPALEKAPEAVVQSLVVAAGQRGSGLGRTMMNLAERWATDAGYESVSLSSQVSRDDAHSFYDGLGYVRYATSHQLRKRLAD